MSEIVLVHGIGQEQKSADVLEREWIPALAGGIRIAGAPHIADRLRREDAMSCRMAFYGNLFLEQGQQGGGEANLAELDQGMVDGLAREWLRRAATRASVPRVRLAAARQMELLAGSRPGEQGLAEYARSTINALAKVPCFGRLGMHLAERFIVKALAQVTIYMTDPDTRRAAVSAILDQVDETTKVVVAHSLGSIVAYEALHRLEGDLPLFITMGSPLGLRTIVYDRLVPRPPQYPPRIVRWVNVSDPDDIVAAEPELRSLFSGSVLARAHIEDSPTANNGNDPHAAESYLGKWQVAKPVIETLDPGIRHASA
jgi:hypothetical protein